MGENENMSEEDYLKKHLGMYDNGGETVVQSSQNSLNDFIDNENTTVGDLQYFHFDVSMLPCGKYYPMGSALMVRPAEVKEIQTFSMVDENNIQDIIEKINYMLRECVRIKYPNKEVGTYLDIKDQDRFYILFLIRELTFQKGNELTVKTVCPDDNEDVNIPLKRENFVFFEVDEKFDKYFNEDSASYNFRLKNGVSYEITPPNIGLQKAFSDFIIDERKNEKKANLSFLKIIPFLLPGRSSITIEGIKKKLKEFEEMDTMSFQFLNSVINGMKLGIKELKMNHTCGQEIRTPLQFPDGIASLFLVSDAFEEYLEE